MVEGHESIGDLIAAYYDKLRSRIAVRDDSRGDDVASRGKTIDEIVKEEVGLSYGDEIVGNGQISFEENRGAISEARPKDADSVLGARLSSKFATRKKSGDKPKLNIVYPQFKPNNDALDSPSNVLPFSRLNILNSPPAKPAFVNTLPAPSFYHPWAIIPSPQAHQFASYGFYFPAGQTTQSTHIPAMGGYPLGLFPLPQYQPACLNFAPRFAYRVEDANSRLNHPASFRFGPRSDSRRTPLVGAPQPIATPPSASHHPFRQENESGGTVSRTAKREISDENEGGKEGDVGTDFWYEADGLDETRYQVSSTSQDEEDEVGSEKTTTVYSPGIFSYYLIIFFRR